MVRHCCARSSSWPCRSRSSCSSCPARSGSVAWRRSAASSSALFFSLGYMTETRRTGSSRPVIPRARRRPPGTEQPASARPASPSAGARPPSGAVRATASAAGTEPALSRRPTPAHRPHVAGTGERVAGRAGQLQPHGGATVPVLQGQRGRAGLGQVAVAPLHQGDEGRIEVTALLGQPVLVALPLPLRLVRHPREDAGRDERAEPVGEHRLRRPEVRWKSAKRRVPRNASRSTSRLHFSPITPRVPATEHPDRSHAGFAHTEHNPAGFT